MLLVWLACGGVNKADDSGSHCMDNLATVTVQVGFSEWDQSWATLEGSRIHVDDSSDPGVFETLANSDGSAALDLGAGTVTIWASNHTDGQCFQSEQVELILNACEPELIELTLVGLEGC